MPTQPWTADDIGDLTGHTILVTGANSGIGLETARCLAGSGATVLLACRDTAKAERALHDIVATHPAAELDVVELDLADLTSVEVAAAKVAQDHPRLDVLVNNAGVMGLPYRQTVDGFELQFGTNHLGHFALTGRLLDSLLAAPAPRVVTVSSGLHRIGRMDFDNLDGTKGYRKWSAYGMSKLANLLYTSELQRRASAAGSALRAVAAHPGYAHTNLQTTGPRMAGAKLEELASHAGNFLLSQSPQMGALPSLRAAVGAGIEGGDYLGPRGPFEMRGHPVRVSPSRAARDTATARRLWEVSEDLTGVRFAALP